MTTDTFILDHLTSKLKELGNSLDFTKVAATFSLRLPDHHKGAKAGSYHSIFTKK